MKRISILSLILSCLLVTSSLHASESPGLQLKEKAKYYSAGILGGSLGGIVYKKYLLPFQRGLGPWNLMIGVGIAYVASMPFTSLMTWQFMMRKFRGRE